MLAGITLSKEQVRRGTELAGVGARGTAGHAVAVAVRRYIGTVRYGTSCLRWRTPASRQ